MDYLMCYNYIYNIEKHVINKLSKNNKLLYYLNILILDELIYIINEYEINDDKYQYLEYTIVELNNANLNLFNLTKQYLVNIIKFRKFIINIYINRIFKHFRLYKKKKLLLLKKRTIDDISKYIMSFKYIKY